MLNQGYREIINRASLASLIGEVMSTSSWVSKPMSSLAPARAQGWSRGWGPAVRMGTLRPAEAPVSRQENFIRSREFQARGESVSCVSFYKTT